MNLSQRQKKNCWCVYADLCSANVNIGCTHNIYKLGRRGDFVSKDYLNKTVVTINQQQYALKGEESVDRMEEMAQLVDRKIAMLKRAFPNCNPVRLSILAALEIAGEYLKLQDDYDELVTAIEDHE